MVFFSQNFECVSRGCTTPVKLDMPNATDSLASLVSITLQASLRLPVLEAVVSKHMALT